MAAYLHKKDNQKYWRVTELKELFFYTLYGWLAYWDMNVINPYTARRIKQQTKIDVTNYKLQLRSDELKHLLYRHFVESNVKQRGITIQDIEKLPEVVNRFTSVIPQENDTLLFETRFPNNETFILVMEIKHNKRLLLGKSFRIKT